MDMNALTANVSVERRVRNRVRPYGGFGADIVLVNETSDAVNLRSERIVVPHVFAGVDVPLLQRVTVGVEIMRGALTTTQLQVGAVLF
jgi:opacity protein-like surface antigen